MEETNHSQDSAVKIVILQSIRTIAITRSPVHFGKTHHFLEGRQLNGLLLSSFPKLTFTATAGWFELSLASSLEVVAVRAPLGSCKIEDMEWNVK